MSEDFGVALRTIEAEGQGVCRFVMLKPHDMPPLGVAAVDGDSTARLMLGAITTYFAQLVSQERRHFCLLCHRRLGRRAAPAVVCFLTADRDDASVALGHGICGRCAKAPDLKAVVLRTYNDELGELRELQVSPYSGRA